MRSNETSEFHSVCPLFQEMPTLKYTYICICCICICTKKSFKLSLGFQVGELGIWWREMQAKLILNTFLYSL